MRSARLLNAAAGLGCAALIVYALVLQWVDGLEPCPLCIFQRVAFATMAVFFFLGAVLPGKWVAAGIGLAALSGVGLAGRHLWLQSLPPDQVPACGPGLDYMLGTFPLSEVFAMVLSGSGECAEVDTVFGLSIPLWTLFAFVLFGVLGVFVNLSKRTFAAR